MRKVKYTIKNEQIEKHKLLNHENEITRKAAQEVYDRYLGMSAMEKRAGKWKW
jgi:hypothetical protein